MFFPIRECNMLFEKYVPLEKQLYFKERGKEDWYFKDISRRDNKYIEVQIRKCLLGINIEELIKRQQSDELNYGRHMYFDNVKHLRKYNNLDFVHWFYSLKPKLEKYNVF